MIYLLRFSLFCCAWSPTIGIRAVLECVELLVLREGGAQLSAVQNVAEGAHEPGVAGALVRGGRLFHIPYKLQQLSAGLPIIVFRHWYLRRIERPRRLQFGPQRWPQSLNIRTQSWPHACLHSRVEAHNSRPVLAVRKFFKAHPFVFWLNARVIIVNYQHVVVLLIAGVIYIEWTMAMAVPHLQSDFSLRFSSVVEAEVWKTICLLEKSTFFWSLVKTG